MFNRVKKLSGIGNSIFDSLSFGGIPTINCPNAGILLRTIDTSRNENDAAGNTYYMPYTTSVYTNGVCGETNLETWGLQYFPAGWVTSIDTSINQESYTFATWDGSAFPSQTIDVSSSITYNTEDGTGINTPIYQGYNYLVNPWQIVQELFDGYAYRWFVQRNGSNDGFEFHDYTMWPSYGTSLGSGSSTAYILISEYSNNYVAAGNEYYDTYADGYGGSYNIVTNQEWFPGGTYLVTTNTYNGLSQDPYDGIDYVNGIVYDDIAVMNGGLPYGDGTYTIQTFANGSYYSYGTTAHILSDSPQYIYWADYQFLSGVGTRDERQWDGSGGFFTAYGISYGSYNEGYIGDYYNQYDGYYYALYLDGYGGLFAYQI